MIIYLHIYIYEDYFIQLYQFLKNDENNSNWRRWIYWVKYHLVDRLVEFKHKVTVLDNLSTGRLKNLNKSQNKIKFHKVDLAKK